LLSLVKAFGVGVGVIVVVVVAVPDTVE